MSILSRNALIAKILSSIASVVERLDDRELENFVESVARAARNARRAPIAEARNKHAKIDHVELEKVLNQLSEMPTRQDGFDLLEKLTLSRKELESLAKIGSVHVIKDDNVGRIKEKLVETIIGSRLSSKAIRGQ